MENTLRLHYWMRDAPICFTCRHIDLFMFNVADEECEPHGYDGMALCKISEVDKSIISPFNKKCNKYEKCTLKQAKYEEN